MPAPRATKHAARRSAELQVEVIPPAGSPGTGADTSIGSPRRLGQDPETAPQLGDPARDIDGGEAGAQCRVEAVAVQVQEGTPSRRPATRNEPALPAAQQVLMRRSIDRSWPRSATHETTRSGAAALSRGFRPCLVLPRPFFLDLQSLASATRGRTRRVSALLERCKFRYCSSARSASVARQKTTP